MALENEGPEYGFSSNLLTGFGVCTLVENGGDIEEHKLGCVEVHSGEFLVDRIVHGSGGLDVFEDGVDGVGLETFGNKEGDFLSRFDVIGGHLGKDFTDHHGVGIYSADGPGCGDMGLSVSGDGRNNFHRIGCGKQVHYIFGDCYHLVHLTITMIAMYLKMALAGIRV